MSKGGGGGAPAPSQTTTTVNNDPWPGVADVLQRIQIPMALSGMTGGPMVDWGRLFNENPEAYQQYLMSGQVQEIARNYPLQDYMFSGFQFPQYFGGSTVVPYSPQTLMGLNAIEGRALMGSPITGAAQQGLLDTLSGMGFTGNPAVGGYQRIAGGHLLANPAFNAIQPFSSGDVVGSNIGYGFMDPFAAGGMVGANPAQYAAALAAARGGPGQYMERMASGIAPSPGGDLAGDVAGAGPGPAGALFGETAGGGFLGANPYLDAIYEAGTRPMIRQYTDQIIPGITGQFASAGRYGSGLLQNAQDMAQENLGQALSDTAARIYGPAYESERNRMLQASGAIQGAYDTDQARRLSAAGLLSGESARQLAAAQGLGNYMLGGAGLLSNIYGGDIAAQLGAAQNMGQLMAGEQGLQFGGAQALGGLYNQAIANQLEALGGMGGLYGDERLNQLRALSFAPQLAAEDYADMGRLMGVGGAYEDLASRELQDEINRWNFQQQFTDLGRLNLFSPYLNSYGGGSTTSTGMAMAPGGNTSGNPLLGALGGGMLGYQASPYLASALGLSSLGPWGMLGGAALGALGSLWS